MSSFSSWLLKLFSVVALPCSILGVVGRRLDTNWWKAWCVDESAPGKVLFGIAAILWCRALSTHLRTATLLSKLAADKLATRSLVGEVTVLFFTSGDLLLSDCFEGGVLVATSAIDQILGFAGEVMRAFEVVVWGSAGLGAAGRPNVGDMFPAPQPAASLFSWPGMARAWCIERFWSVCW